MNWSKAKTILIIALIITNGFLILTYGNFGAKSESFRDTAALSEFLAEKSIYVDAGAIPLQNRDMPVLYVYNEAGNCEALSLISSGSERRAGGTGDEDYKRAADSFIREFGQKYGTAVFYGLTREGDSVRVVYGNAVHDVTIEESYLICVFKNGVLTDVECDWLEVVSVPGKPQETVSASQSLLLFMAQAEIGAGIYIDGIEMVYWLDRSVELGAPVSEDTALPVWKITFNGGDFSYIDAFVHN